ncbi:DUF6370 family protein [Zavarzinella formosa]|uniref:DUF6370 family protein n=1 Tax=Zavarzinella formosa TaxID=360055 RepID=UPI0002D2F2AF|nr:DUF6370 family protein [Zavarzinella formosa]
MLRMLTAFVLGFGVLGMTVASTVSADDKKEEKLVGTVTCAKCGLKIKGQEDCATVIKVGEKVYWFDEKGHEANHKPVCGKGKEGTVTGVTGKDGDKLTVTVSKVELKK